MGRLFIVFLEGFFFLAPASSGEACCASGLLRRDNDAGSDKDLDLDSDDDAAAVVTEMIEPTTPPEREQRDAVWIGPGEFWMGTDRPKILGDGEGPSRRVRLTRGFEMDKYETSNRDFRRFVDATNYATESEAFGWSFVFHLETTSSDHREKARRVQGAEWWLAVNGSYWREPHGPGSDVFLAGKADYPVVQVSWADASNYCHWKGGRLPTEAEWEFAARDRRTALLFPWGNDLEGGEEGDDTGARANIWQGTFPDVNSAVDGFVGAAPVGHFPAQTSTGLHDVIGNVWEWVSDWWSLPDDDDDARRTHVDPTGPKTGTEKVKKGGSFLCHRSYCYRYRCAARHKNTPDSATSNNGFRCVYERTN